MKSGIIYVDKENNTKKGVKAYEIRRIEKKN